MGVRAVETMTASRANSLLLGEQQSEPLGRQRGLFLAFDLDRNAVAHQPLPRRFLLRGVKREATAHALARADGREEADAVEAIVHPHLQALWEQRRLGGKARKQGEREEAVGDRPAER